MMISEEMVQSDAWKSLKKTLDVLKKKKKVLLLSCSNRHNWDENDIDIPKSKMIAMYLKDELGDKSTLIDVSELNIVPCEGNVSTHKGNVCGVKDALLKTNNPNKFMVKKRGESKKSQKKERSNPTRFTMGILLKA